MNKDADYQSLRNGDYPHGKNIRPVTNSGGSLWDNENIIGNLYVADLGLVDTQDKVYLAYINTLDAATEWEFTIYDPNGNIVVQVSLVVGAQNFAAYIIALRLLIDAAIPANWSYIISELGITADTGLFYLTVSQAPYDGIDYTFTVQNITPTPAVNADLFIYSEAIDLSISGIYRAIGSWDLLGDLFVWATPCTKLPQSFEAFAAVDVGGLIQVETLTPHGMTVANNGEVISISGTGTNADGSWMVTYVSANELILEGSVWNGLGATGTLTKNVNYYGTIASVIYDINTDVWTLTKLIRTRDFPFTTKKQIQGEVHRSNVEDAVLHSFYWVDRNDIPRAFYYQGTFINDGAIDILNPQTNLGDNGLYEYGLISDETRLLLNSNRARLSYTGMVQNGGAVKAGNNRYSFFLETENGGKTALQLLTNPINVYSAEESTSNNKFIIGDAPGASTPKIVQLEITGLDVGLFKYINLVNVLQVAPGAYIITNVSRTEITDETMQLQHSGLEQNSFPMSASELLVETRDIKTGWHIVSLDSILVLGNITENDEIDLLPVTTNVWHTLHRHTMDMCGFITNLGPACEYQVVDHVHNRAGYRYGETVRFGLRPKYKINGATGKVSWIDDIRFDNSITNIVNTANTPYGNRRGWKIKDITVLADTPAPGDSTLLIETEGETGLLAGGALTIADVTGLVPLVSINAAQTVTIVNTPTQFNIELLGVAVTGTYDAYSGHITNALPDAALTNDPTVDPLVDGEVYTFYPQFSNINWDYVLDDGRRLRDVVESFEIVRCEVIDEILLTGIVLSGDPYGGGTWYPQMQWVGSPTVADTTNQTTPLGGADRRLGFFVSPDILLDYRRTAYSNGDQIIIYGTAQARYIQLNTLPAGANKDKYFEWNGDFADAAAPLTVNLENAINVSKGDSGTIVATTIGSVPYSLTDIGGHQWDMNMVLAAGPNAGDFFQGALLDPGVLNCAYFHALTDKYGGIEEGKYIPTGHYYKPGINEGSRINNQAVFGGDVFTQKTYLHLVYKFATTDFVGFTISFYSQNKANTQNRYYDPNDTGILFPSHATSIDIWTAQLASGPRDQFHYNKGYSIYNELNQLLAYDPDLQIVTDHPALLVWTPLKVLGGLVDAWRIIMPLAFKYLDLSKGEITGVWVLNGELYVMQQRAFTRQFFNSRGILQTTDSEEIILGSGDVLSRNGIPLTTIGCLEKWNQLKGMSESGDDTLYWVNTEHYKFCRFAADGTRVISDIQGMESWFANYLPWVRRKDNPADDEGTCAVWNGRFHEAIFTFRGRKRTDEWHSSGPNYEIGDEVHLLDQPAGTYTNFSQTGEIYVCILNHSPATPEFEPETGADWETVWRKVSHTEKEYFSEFTLIYSEKEKKAFICFTSFLPNIYLQVGNGYMTPRPSPQTGEGETFAQNKIYWHNHGEICEWYKTGAYASINAMDYTAGSATLRTVAGFLTMFPHPEVYTYTIPILGIDYYVESVQDDQILTLQTLYDINENDPENPTPILPASGGTVNTYYVSLAEDAEIHMVVNEEPNISKDWEYIQFNTEIVPYRVDFEAPGGQLGTSQQSFLNQQEFEFLENYWYGQVKSDSTATPTVNDNDTSDLFGPWLKVGLKMRRFVYQKIRNLIAVCRNNLPNPLQ